MRNMAAAALAAGLALAGAASATQELDRLFADYWANELEEKPFLATGVGVEDYNDRVPGAAPEDEARRLAESQKFLARLEAADLEGASDEDRLNAALLRFILKHDIALAAFDGWRIPFLSDYGFHQDLGFAIDSTPFRTEADYENYLKRLERYPAYLDQNIENMRRGLADGFAQPKEILGGILPSFDAQVTETAGDHPLYAPFRDMPATISKKRAAAIRANGAALLEGEVIPAFRRVADFMRNEYAPNAADRIGAGNLPGGAAYYEALVRYYTTRDDVTADEIHKLGLKEVARIRAEMNDVIRKTGFKGDFAAFLDFLRTDPQFYATTPESLLERAAYLAKTIDGKLPGYFGKLPRQPYSVEAVPDEIAPNYTSGRYVAAPPGGKRGGRYWVNTC